MVFKHLCALVHRTWVASALGGLSSVVLGGIASSRWQGLRSLGWSYDECDDIKIRTSVLAYAGDINSFLTFKFALENCTSDFNKYFRVFYYRDVRPTREVHGLHQHAIGAP